MSHLGDYFRNRRIAWKLTLSQVARLLGYENLSRGCNRIKAFETGGKAHPDFLRKLAKVLEVGPEEVRQRVAEDYRDWLAWANEPVRPEPEHKSSPRRNDLHSSQVLPTWGLFLSPPWGLHGEQPPRRTP